jgi:DNA repair exonuclease SbcCD ATPase subunit
MNLQTDIQQKDRDIINLGKLNLKLQQQIQNLKEFQPNVQEENEILDSLKIELQNTAKNCSDINKQLSEYQTVSYLLKDSGIKSTVIKKYVPVFNQLINKYLQSMEFYVNFTLDNEFNEVIKSRFRDDFSYSSFSEGEKQKIDLALLFTWREVARMKNSASTNLLILDEVFDSSLDDSSTQELLKILRGLEKVNLFVISHKGEILIDKFLRTIKFEKVNDFSKLSYDP